MAHPSTPSSSGELLCHRCGAAVRFGDGSFYVVRIEAFADPTPPNFDENEASMDMASEWEQLLEQMRHMSEQELLDQVYRRLALHLCVECYRGWIENPTGS